ncbi:M4 family metallopeptidase [Actinosynnema sp. NPDC020468]|uniref:M4 family metallopeptidase n=1 Tax=Actinosynnema sp. NPDC020468 TaxID=3154488 RepID=UPI0033FFC9B3
MKRQTLVGYAALVAAALVGSTAATAVAAPQAPDQLGLGAQEQLVQTSTITDADGTVFTHYDRTYRGLKVVGGDLIVERTKAGKVKSVARTTDAKIELATTTPSSAADRGELVVFALDHAPTLAWEKVTESVSADKTPSELHVFTDAKTGAELLRYDSVMHLETGSGVSTWSGTVALDTTKSGSTYQLKDPLRGNQQVNNLNGGTSTGTLFTDADNKWGNGTQSDKATAGVDAAYGAAKTWDYYKNTHGRNGIRNDGVGALSKVHYSTNYVNAFWTDSCFCMTYGDGQNNAKPLTSLDVAGHEMSHGVTSVTAKLVYSGESGGLNEATSDIFGTAVEFAANNPADVGDYLIGEKIDIRGNGTPLRYMDKPSKDGASADYWSSTVGSKDVHYSSGVANHFFYLLSEGSGAKTINGVSYNSPTQDGQSVTGIGRDKAEKIWYRALTTKFTSGTKYAAARTGTLAAASELYGASSAEYAAVNRAWAAVNVK